MQDGLCSQKTPTTVCPHHHHLSDALSAACMETPKFYLEMMNNYPYWLEYNISSWKTALDWSIFSESPCKSGNKDVTVKGFMCQVMAHWTNLYGTAQRRLSKLSVPSSAWSNSESDCPQHTWVCVGVYLYASFVVFSLTFPECPGVKSLLSVWCAIPH